MSSSRRCRANSFHGAWKKCLPPLFRAATRNPLVRDVSMIGMGRSLKEIACVTAAKWSVFLRLSLPVDLQSGLIGGMVLLRGSCSSLAGSKEAFGAAGTRHGSCISEIFSWLHLGSPNTFVFGYLDCNMIVGKRLYSKRTTLLVHDRLGYPFYQLCTMFHRLKPSRRFVMWRNSSILNRHPEPFNVGLPAYRLIPMAIHAAGTGK